MQRVLVPVDASVGSAVGFLRAPIAFELARSLQVRDDSFAVSHVNEHLQRMQTEAKSIVAAGALGEPLATQRSVEMRYLGQGHEISVPLPERALVKEDAASLRAEYESRYEEQFGLRIADVPVEFLTWSVSVSTLPGEVVPSSSPAETKTAIADEKHEVFDPGSGNKEPVPVYRRQDLASGMQLAGPALIVEPQTTTLVPRGWRSSVTAAGHLLLERQS